MRPRLAAFLVFVAASVCLWQVPDFLREMRVEIANGRDLTSEERRLGPAHATGVDPRFLQRARKLVPPNATFAVLDGPEVEPSSSATLDAVEPLTAFWLLPARRVLEPAEADWVLSYGGDLDALGLDYVGVEQIAPGIAIAEVRR